MAASPSPSAPSNPGPLPRVVVTRVRGERGVVATEPIGVGEEVLAILGVVTDRPSRTSIQVGEREHVDIPPDLPADRVGERYPWQFLNHGCGPNAAVVGRSLVALRRIGRGDEITFDYNATEYDMASPFRCRCGGPSCRGALIAGFRHLSPDERTRVLPHATPAVLACVAHEERRARRLA